MKGHHVRLFLVSELVIDKYILIANSHKMDVDVVVSALNF
jgi:hypothetical protein